MEWKEIWMTFFGRTEWLGLDVGFWVGILLVVWIVIVMNIVFWGMKPHETKIHDMEQRKRRISHL